MRPLVIECPGEQDMLKHVEQTSMDTQEHINAFLMQHTSEFPCL